MGTVSKISIEIRISNSVYTNEALPLVLSVVSFNSNRRVLHISDIQQDSEEFAHGKIFYNIFDHGMSDGNAPQIGIILRTSETHDFRMTGSSSFSFSLVVEYFGASASKRIDFASEISLSSETGNVDWYCIGILTFQRHKSKSNHSVYFRDVSSFPWKSGNVAAQMEELIASLSEDLLLIERDMSSWYDLCSHGQCECVSLRSRLEAQTTEIQILKESNKLLQEQLGRCMINARNDAIVSKLTDDMHLEPFSQTSPGVTLKYQENLIVSIREQLQGLSNRINR